MAFLSVMENCYASFTSFDLVYSMTGGGPGRATELLVTYVYKLAFTLTKFDYAAAMTVVMFVLFLAIALIANRLSGGDAGKVDGNGQLVGSSEAKTRTWNTGSLFRW